MIMMAAAPTSLVLPVFAFVSGQDSTLAYTKNSRQKYIN
jgi:hypothetical protein